MSWIKLCEAADVKPGEMIPAEAEGLPPLAVYNVDGEFYVTSNVCTHNVATLTDGYLEGDIVECPLHGGCFNVKTGVPAHFPCTEPLPVYKTELRDGAVFVEAP